MARWRIRDLLSFVTTLPASTILAVCLFLPHTRDCHGHTKTALESGTWAAIVPLIFIGLMPIVWRFAPKHERQGFPEILLAFTLLALAMFVITIPIAIWLMWGYSKRSFRGELLAALCSTTLAILWLIGFPILLVFSTWLPAAQATWGAGIAEVVGLLLWTSAAAARDIDDDDDAPAALHPRSSSASAGVDPTIRRSGITSSR